MTDATLITLLVSGAALLSALSTVATLATRAAVAELRADLVAEIAKTREHVARDYLPRHEIAGVLERLETRLQRIEQHGTVP